VIIVYFSPEGSQEHIASIDTDRLAQGVSNVLLAVTPRLKDFHSLLIEPPQVSILGKSL
jgi:serine/threonine-protein phosphatase 6 regulatory subunit 3